MPSLPDMMDDQTGATAASVDGWLPQAQDRGALFDALLRLGDNALVLGHRLSEWCGHGPALEEDIAMANTALDLIGQTRLWLGYAGEIEGAGRDADALAFLRDVWDFRNLQMLELPNGDFGQTLMRQFLFDAFHHVQLARLTASADPRIAEIAAKSAKEVAYHLERSGDLVVRLGDGSAESHDRMQAALNDLWPYVGEMFAPVPGEIDLAAAGVAPDPAGLRAEWDAIVLPALTAATLNRPDGDWFHKGGKTGSHTEHLGYLLAEMQFLQRAYPGARW